MFERQRTSLATLVSRLACAAVTILAGVSLRAADLDQPPLDSPLLSQPVVDEYRASVQPILAKYCYDCHANGSTEAGVALDVAETDDAVRADPQLWWKVIKQLRAGLMPAEGEKLTADELATVEAWVKRGPFHFDPADPDPGHVILRRLNRTEYKNTIRDLLGVDFDADGAFPPDDSGHGFDNIGEALSVSPLLLEKYVDAAGHIIAQAVPMAARTVAERRIPGARFHLATEAARDARGRRGPLDTSFYKPAKATYEYKVKHAGTYRAVFDLEVREVYVDGIFDYNKARVTLSVDGQVRKEATYSWQGEEGDYHYELEQHWDVGKHELTVELTPLTPDEKQTRTMSLRLKSATIRGPLEQEHWVRPANYAKYFPKEPPTEAGPRREYARELLAEFAGRAYRRPVDDATLDRLAGLAEATYNQPGGTFESGVAKAMTVILASPRFLFREESPVADASSEPFPAIDEYALASRLSYFLWSSMPDEELFRLAREGKLRQELPAQITRMLADKRSEALTRNFVGQWLQVRDVDAILINSFVVASRDDKPNPDFDKQRKRFRRLNRKEPEKLTEKEKQELNDMRMAFRTAFAKFREFDLNGDLRHAMRRETEMHFDYVIRENHPLSELLDCNYAFLNERLARLYKIDGVTGDEFRRVELPAGSHRGGILTEGTVLVVTSNPDRTSPVKRGQFILDNILGMPAAPPPPGIPPLPEEPADPAHPLTLRVTLEKHRSDPLCSSCHSRMDPLGLAMENFNALGVWRETDRGEPVDSAGELITGEKFAGVDDLKRILVERHSREFYRCFTEKLLTYALGRGLDYHDVGVVDQIVDKIEQAGGKPADLIRGIVESAPFQRMRAASSPGGEPVAQADAAASSTRSLP